MLLPAAPEVRAQSTGMFKVIELLGEKEEETKKMMHEDAVVAAAYAQWCTGEQTSLEAEIENLEEKVQLCPYQKLLVFMNVDKYGARAESEAAKQKTMTEEATTLRAKVAEDQKTLADITAVREKEAAEAKATITDYAESLDAIDRAILTMQSKAAAALTSFLSTVEQLDAKSGAVQEPGTAYEQGKVFKDVIRLLQQLEDKFQSEKQAAQVAEQNAVHSYTQQRMDLEHQIETATNEAEKKDQDA
eukprot:g11113.t1